MTHNVIATFWDHQAYTINQNDEGKIIAIGKAIISNYLGKSLRIDGPVKINPDCKIHDDLKQLTKLDASQLNRHISHTTSVSTVDFGEETSIADILVKLEDYQRKRQEYSEMFAVVGIITEVSDEFSIYLASKPDGKTISVKKNDEQQFLDRNGNRYDKI